MGVTRNVLCALHRDLHQRVKQLAEWRDPIMTDPRDGAEEEELGDV